MSLSIPVLLVTPVIILGIKEEEKNAYVSTVGWNVQQRMEAGSQSRSQEEKKRQDEAKREEEKKKMKPWAQHLFFFFGFHSPLTTGPWHPSRQQRGTRQPGHGPGRRR